MSFESIYKEFSDNGLAVIPNFLSEVEIKELSEEISSIVKDMTVPELCSCRRSHDDYFMNSGDKIAFFLERDAVDDEGKLAIDKEKALYKMGHALHCLNPVFKRVTFSQKIKSILKNLEYENPVVVQSRVIFMHPETGGEVKPHQDSTLLYTDPPSAFGIWIPLVDTTLENGCLWFIPGSHKEGQIYQRLIRNPDGRPRLILKGEIPKFDDNLYTPVLFKKGDCMIIHGSIVHKSGKNTSNKSIPIYTFHVVEQKNTEYSKENWLQPSEKLPFPSLFSMES